jgi:hypothetical protein
MYIGGYLFLIIVGALLRWAVIYSPPEFDLQTAGLIIMLVGILGLVISVLVWFDRRRYAAPPHGGRYADEVLYPGAQERIVHEHVVRDEQPQERIVHEYVPPPRDQDDDTPRSGYPENDTASQDTLERTPPTSRR